nr:hypothetical protein [Tanacetum cinerariifolium]
LLAKWVWRFLSQDNSLWCQLIFAIHGSSTKDLSTTYPSTWNSIIKEFNYLKVQGVDVFSHCKIRIDTVKDISVAGKLQSPLVFSFRRNVRGGIEEQQLEHLVALLDSVILSNSNDRWVSYLNRDGVFRVNNMRNLLDEFFFPRADVPMRNGGIFVVFILYRYLVTIVPTFWPNNPLSPELTSTQRYRLKPLKVLPHGEVSGATLGLLSPSMMQVTEHQKLLGEKIMHLSGEASMVRLQNALFETQRQYSKSKEKSSFVEPPVTHIVPSNDGPNGRSDSVGQLPFLDHDSMSLLEDTGSSVDSGLGFVKNFDGEMLGMKNVFIMNKFLHGRRYGDNDSLNITDENQKENYDHVVVLMKEVRDELCEMYPKTRKQVLYQILRCISFRLLDSFADHRTKVDELTKRHT